MKKQLPASILGMALAFMSSGAPATAADLEQRVAALEALSASHTSQLAALFAAEAQSPQILLPQNDFTKLASLTLPAGRYVLSGQIFGWPADTKPKNEGIGCQLRVSDKDGNPVGNVTDAGGGQGSLIAYYFNINPIGTMTFPDGGIAWLQCRTNNANTVVIGFTKLIAIAVPRFLEPEPPTRPNPPVLESPK